MNACVLPGVHSSWIELCTIFVQILTAKNDLFGPKGLNNLITKTGISHKRPKAGYQSNVMSLKWDPFKHVQFSADCTHAKLTLG